MNPLRTMLPSESTEESKPLSFDAPVVIPPTKPSMAMPGVMPEQPRNGASEAVQVATRAPSAFERIIGLISRYRTGPVPLSRLTATEINSLESKGLIVKGQKWTSLSQKGLNYLEDLVLDDDI